LESDLLRFWHLDMARDLGTDRLTWRRLGVLIGTLPPESATLREINGPEYSAWQTTDYLLAAVVDVLQGANWQRGGGKGARPKPLPRPKSLLQLERERREHEEAQERVRALRERRKNGGGD
jgi:hypothetical protein